jgi:hypothetical protein
VDKSDISGSNGRRIQKRAPKGSKKSKARRNAFTATRKETFLEHFAATANAKAAARAAGVSIRTVYQHRKDDPEFRERWADALDQGYARLEAELVRRASTPPRRVKADEQAARANETIDPKVALAILESYRRNGNSRPGEILLRPYDIEQVRQRLEAKMRALAMLPDDEESAE